MAQQQQINPNLLLFAGLAIGGYFVASKILEGLGLKKTSEQKEQEKLSKTGREKFIEDTLKNPNKSQTAGGKPTRTEGQYALWADQLYEFLRYTALDDKKNDAFNLLYIRMQNDADIAQMVKYFGKRQEYAFGLPIGQPKNFSEFISTNLTSKQIQTLNDRYAKSKMRFRF